MEFIRVFCTCNGFIMYSCSSLTSHNALSQELHCMSLPFDRVPPIHLLAVFLTALA